MRTALVLLALGLPIVGCGSDETGDSTPVSVDEFPARFASAWCAMTKRCCEDSGGTYNDACEADLAAEIMERGMGAMADGASWDGQTAGQCLDAIGAADCAGTDLAALVAMLDACDDTWNGVVPPGEACMTYESCAEPTVSGGASAGASCVNSTCVQVVRQPVGETCFDEVSGSILLTCNTLEAECVGGICVPLPGDGGTCSGSCRAGMRCAGERCVPLLPGGAACTTDSECASDSCNGDTCASVLAASIDDHCTLP